MDFAGGRGHSRQQCLDDLQLYSVVLPHAAFVNGMHYNVDQALSIAGCFAARGSIRSRSAEITTAIAPLGMRLS